jgi:SAM-dependent methyltransferase
MDVADALDRYSWYHCIDLGAEVRTPGLRIMLPLQAPIMDELHRHDLTGKRVLDIGCRDGLFSFEAEKMGASEVVGIDNDLSLGATEFLIPYFNSKVQMRAVSLYDFKTDEPFDFVLFAGVLYHLRFPFLGLKKIADAMKPGATLIIETSMLATRDNHALLYCPAPEDSPHEPTSVTFYNHAGLTAALRSFGFIDIECRYVRSGGSLYPNWETFRSSLFQRAPHWLMRLAAAAMGKEKPHAVKIARAIYVAKKSTPDESLDGYWYGNHSLHSFYADNNEFLRKAKVEGLLET